MMCTHAEMLPSGLLNDLLWLWLQRRDHNELVSVFGSSSSGVCECECERVCVCFIVAVSIEYCAEHSLYN